MTRKHKEFLLSRGKHMPKCVINIELNDLFIISEALVVYQLEVEDDTAGYYRFPYSVEQIQKVIDQIEQILDNEGLIH